MGFLTGAPEVVVALTETGGLEQAEAVVKTYLARTSAADLAFYGALGRLMISRLRLAQGRLDEALGAANEAVESLKENGARPDLIRALFQRGRVLQSMGNLEEAAADYQAAEALAAEIGMAIDDKLLGRR
jgi:tetratricopeptide (TPR) repeat protein